MFISYFIPIVFEVKKRNYCVYIIIIIIIIK